MLQLDSVGAHSLSLPFILMRLLTSLPCSAFSPSSAWSIGKKGELTEVACRKRAHNERVTAIALKRGLLYSGTQLGLIRRGL